MPNATEMKFLRDSLSHGFTIMLIDISLFQHDNAKSHTARDTANFLRANNIAFINDWPAKSPDLNPTEHFWDNLDQLVRRRPIPSSHVIQLGQALIQKWNNNPQAEINTLIRSMLQRCQALPHAKMLTPGINRGFW